MTGWHMTLLEYYMIPPIVTPVGFRKAQVPMMEVTLYENGKQKWLRDASEPSQGQSGCDPDRVHDSLVCGPGRKKREAQVSMTAKIQDMDWTRNMAAWKAWGRR